MGTDSKADHALVQAALGGDRRAIDELLTRLRCVPRFLQWRNYRFGKSFGHADIEDLQQEVLLQIWKSLGSYRGDGSLEAWLQRISYLVFMQEVRRRGRHPPLLPNPAVLDVSDDPPTIDASDREQIYRSLEQLDPLDAQLLRLRHFDGLAFSEAALRVGLPLATAKTRYYRALAKLRQTLQSNPTLSKSQP